MYVRRGVADQNRRQTYFKNGFLLEMVNNNNERKISLLCFEHFSLLASRYTNMYAIDIFYGNKFFSLENARKPRYISSIEPPKQYRHRRTAPYFICEAQV